MNDRDDLHALGDEELMASLRALVVRSNETEAEMIEHLAEVDERRLYLPGRTSLWDFCLRELGFSENVAATRIAVARDGELGGWSLAGESFDTT